MKRIDVTKTFLPPQEEYNHYLEQIWQNAWLTNQGPLLQKFEKKVKKYLNVQDFHFVGNGTLALQVALRALEITEGEIITTPFSYVATTSAILWQNCKPVYVDIEPETFCIDADKIEAAITPQTKAIMPVHVFGNPCDIEKIDTIAKKHGLKVIYDAAHAFGVEYDGRSLLSYSNISTCSFHATKLFHTIEGGCIVAKDKADSNKIELMKRFGHNGDEHLTLGINGKASEFQAAMGLSNLPYIESIIAQRKKLSELYSSQLSGSYQTIKTSRAEKYNYAYYPVVFDNENHRECVASALEKEEIYPRRYFYPSLNKLPYLASSQDCPVSERVAGSILCLPLYAGLSATDVLRICKIIKTVNAA